MSSTTERHVEFLDGFTWVQVTEPDVPTPGAHPLVVLHGGPGFTHDYLRNLAELADATGRTVVHYDQYGCGRSTHRPDAPREFWNPQLFVDEFHNVIAALDITRCHVLGQSWGGMLAAEIGVRRAPEVVSLSICNSPAAMSLWAEAAAQLRAQLPAEIREALERHEADETYDDPEYIAAAHEYDRRHVVRLPDGHPDYAASEANVEADPTVYHTMNGPNEFHVIGTLKDWSIIDRLHLIEVPTLVLAGEFDEAQPIVWQPYVDNIPDVRSYVVAGASHCSHLEKPAEVQKAITDFITGLDEAPGSNAASQETAHE